MIAPKSLTPHSGVIYAAPRGPGRYWVESPRLDGQGVVVLFRGIGSAALLRYAYRHGYLIEWETP